MAKPVSGPDYRHASVPADLAREIVATIRDHPELGYRTLAEFVRHASLDKLRVVHMDLALRALHATAELGAEAVEALLRDALPPEYREVLESERRRHRRV